MRMTASWLRSSRIDRIQGCAAVFAADGELPSDACHVDLQAATSLNVKIEIDNRSHALDEFTRRGNDYGSSVCAFAVKPRAFGAPHAASGLDRSAQPSKSTAVPNAIF
jgi:hypothetical protein